MSHKRRICFVTGTRAEFGLMVRTLREIKAHPKLKLQIIATGMHLSSSRGDSMQEIKRAGFKVDQTVDWDSSDHSPLSSAVETGGAMSGLARAYARLKSEIILVVGDRVEAYAAAAAGQLSGVVVAHVHGGDRALGQADDSLRHAISKLSHIHFPATRQSASRLEKMGEDRWRIVRAGSPGIDGIKADAESLRELEALFGVKRKQFALLLLHPTCADDAAEYTRAKRLCRAITSSGIERVIGVFPNTDPGSAGIVSCWNEMAAKDGWRFQRNLSRSEFLGLLRDCAFLIGNSSSGIIEAASFGTPVIDIGPRQTGRERGENVIHVEDQAKQIQHAIQKAWNKGSPKRSSKRNIYGSGAAKIIVQTLASIQLDERLRRKLIAY